MISKTRKRPDELDQATERTAKLVRGVADQFGLPDEVLLKEMRKRMNTETVLGTVNDAASRYRTDVATVWAWIVSGRTLTSPEGIPVRLMADSRDEHDQWVVVEIEAQ